MLQAKRIAEAQTMRERDANGERWAQWAQNHRELFAELKSGSRIGFLNIEEFERLEGRLVVLTVAEEKVEASTAAFVGLRASGVDVLFVAGRDDLDQLVGAAPAAGGRLFRDLLRRGQVLFYMVAPPEELEDKGYDRLFSALGLGFLGGCVS